MNVIFRSFLLEIDGRERNMPQVNNSSQNIKCRTLACDMKSVCLYIGKVKFSHLLTKVGLSI